MGIREKIDTNARIALDGGLPRRRVIVRSQTFELPICGIVTSAQLCTIVDRGVLVPGRRNENIDACRATLKVVL
jgi:hypothetical protein